MRMVRITWNAGLVLAVAIALQAAAQGITVRTPAAGANLIRGTLAPVTWDYAGLADTTLVKAVLRRNGADIGVIAQGVPIKYALSPSGTGALPDKWKVGDYQGGRAPVGCKYAIQVRTTDGTVAGNSGFFCIVAAGLAPTLKLTSPAGGETWVLNKPGAIAWTCSGASGPVLIHLLKGSQDLGLIAKPDAATGSFTWNVGTLLPPYNQSAVAPGNDYRVAVEAPFIGMTDRSAGPFSITLLVPTSAGRSKPALPGPSSNLSISIVNVEDVSPKSPPNSAQKYNVHINFAVSEGCSLWYYRSYELECSCSPPLNKKWARLLLLRNGQPFRVLIEKFHLSYPNWSEPIFQIADDIPAGDYQLCVETLDAPQVRSDSVQARVVK
jgi:hypothetical protein